MHGTGGTELNLPIKEIRAKSLLTSSRISDVDYCVNPYVGCEHACRYCYATFICKFTDHTEAWGTFLLNKPADLSRMKYNQRGGAVYVI